MFVYLCGDARPAVEETGEHDAVPLVSAVVLRPDLSVVAAHDPADVLAQAVPAEDLLLQGDTLALHLAVEALPPAKKFS